MIKAIHPCRRRKCPNCKAPWTLKSQNLMSVNVLYLRVNFYMCKKCEKLWDSYEYKMWNMAEITQHFFNNKKQL